MLKKIVWLKKLKKQVLMTLFSVMKLLITVENNTYKYKNEIILFKVQKNTENIDSRVSNRSKGRKTILSKWAISGSKKSKFIKNQEAKGLLSNLSVRTPLTKVPVLGDILF